MRNAIEWTRISWEKVSLNTVKNCWNHAKIRPLPVTVTSGPSDAVIGELKAPLVEFSDSSLDVENVVDHATEQWTAAPQLDDENATAAYGEVDGGNDGVCEVSAYMIFFACARCG